MKDTLQPEASLLSIDQVAGELGLHARTVRRYVHEGRLRAVRIGKRYRVAREAVDALTGRTAAASTVPAPAAPGGERHVEVSSIVHVDAIDLDTANRITTGLLAAAKGRPEAPDPLRINVRARARAAEDFPERQRRLDGLAAEIRQCLSGDLAARTGPS